MLKFSTICSKPDKICLLFYYISIFFHKTLSLWINVKIAYEIKGPPLGFSGATIISWIDRVEEVLFLRSVKLGLVVITRHGFHKEPGVEIHK